jgi:hypothetical protein
MSYVSKQVIHYIRNTSSSFGKARLVLKDNRYFIEADTRVVIDFYENQHNLSDCWLYENGQREPDSDDEKGNELKNGEDDDEDGIGDGEPDEVTLATLNQKKIEMEQENKDKVVNMIKTKHYIDFVEDYENFIRDVVDENIKPIPKKMYKLEIDP